MKAPHCGHRCVRIWLTAVSKTCSSCAATGLKGLPEAVEATWPNSMVQTCIVHLIRAANRWVSYQDRKSVSRVLREVYTAANEDTARASLDAFEASELGRKYP